MIETILPYTLPLNVKEELLALAARSDLLLIGETHGTQEVPRLVLGLLDDLAGLGYRGLGLEVNTGQRAGLAAWATGAGDPPPFFGPQEFQDGRGNVQVLSLMRQAVSSSHAWRVLCFDVDFMQEAETGTDRDRHMAENLLVQWEECCLGQKVVGVCGNYHSRLAAPAEPDFGPWPSFGANVQQLRPELKVNAINIVFQRGGFFNGEVRKFDIGAEHFAVSPEVRPNGQFGHTIDLYLPRATPATFLQSL